MASRFLSAAAAILAIATYLYMNQFEDVRSVDEEGYTVLHHAAGSGNLDKLRAQISLGADVNALDASGRTALHLAALTCQKPEALSLLIAAKASVDIPDKNGDSPFHLATYGCHTACVRALIELGANVHMLTENEYRHSALHIAASTDHPDTGGRCADVVSVLVSAGVSPQNQDFKGHTPIIHAMHKNAIKVVEALIVAKADVSMIYDSGQTLLHYAAHYGTPAEILSLLLQARVPVNWLDERNNTALDFCHGRNPVIEENCSLIESAGGKLGLMLNQDLAGDAHDDDDEDMETEAAREHDSV